MPQLGQQFDLAFQYASEIHRSQIRKGSGVPYVSHLLGVASIALEYGADEVQTIAALLHDAVEDQGGRPRLAAIHALFGAEVAEIVLGCTDSTSTPKAPWRARKERYIADLPAKSARTRLVSAADKLHNARTVLADYRVSGEGLWDRFTGGREGTLWYYRALAHAFREVGPGRLAVELDLVVREIEALATRSAQAHLEAIAAARA